MIPLNSFQVCSQTRGGNKGGQLGLKMQLFIDPCTCVPSHFIWGPQRGAELLTEGAQVPQPPSAQRGAELLTEGAQVPQSLSAQRGAELLTEGAQVPQPPSAQRGAELLTERAQVPQPPSAQRGAELPTEGAQVPQSPSGYTPAPFLIVQGGKWEADLVHLPVNKLIQLRLGIKLILSTCNETQ